MFAKVLSAVALVALFARSVVADDCTRSYTVKDGDFCDQISQANNVSTYQLAALNSGKYNPDCTDLAIGAVLCLGTSPDQDCQTTHTVQPSDTCDSVASAAGTNTTILHLNNPQIDDQCFNIYIGEVLCISQTVQVPPMPSGGVVSSPSTNSTSGDTSPSPSPSTSPLSDTTPTPSPSSTVDTAADDNDLPYCDEI